MTLMTGWMVLAGFMVAFAGYALGAGLAKVFRLPTPQIVAVSIETAFQNGGIALLVLQMSFDQPYNDVATIAPIAQMSITGTITYTYSSIFSSSIKVFFKRHTLVDYPYCLQNVPTCDRKDGPTRKS